MRVSTRTVDITPQGPFYLDGYAGDARAHASSEVHDRGFATLLLLEGAEDDAESRVLFVSLDVCRVQRAAVAPMREGLSQVLGMDPTHIIISGTATHSSSNGFDADDVNAFSIKTPGYAAIVTGRVVEASLGLVDALTSVTAELAQTRVSGFFGNRNDDSLPYSDIASVLRFKSADGPYVGSMLELDVQSTVLGPQNVCYSAELMGAVRAKLANWIGCVPYAFIGAGADVSNRNHRQGRGFEELERIAEGTAEQIRSATFAPVELMTPRVNRLFSHVVNDTTSQIPWMEQTLSEIAALMADEGSTYDERKLANTKRIFLERRLNAPVLELDIELLYIDCGPIAFLVSDGGFMSSIGSFAKELFVGNTGQTLLTICFANSNLGYLIPASDYKDGTYESVAALLPSGGIERALQELKEQL